MREGTSFLGANAAEQAELKMASADGIVSQNSVAIPPTPHLVVTKGVSS